MMNVPRRMSQREREALAQLVSTGLAPGPKSNEARQLLLGDRFGNFYNLGGESHSVVVDSDSIPHVLSQEQAMILDCGHAVTSLSQVLGRCDMGHIICNRHQFVRCPECKSVLCDSDLVEKDGELVCPKCTDDKWSAFLGFLVLAGVIALILAIV